MSSGVQIADRVVREGREVNDRVEAPEIRGETSRMSRARWGSRRLTAEVAARVEVRVEPGHIVARAGQLGCEHRADVAMVPVTRTRMRQRHLRREETFARRTPRRSRYATALEAPEPHQAHEVVGVVPVLPGWSESAEDPVELPVDDLLLQRDVDVRPAQVAVPLGDLVLEDEVIAERVPRELARESMVLVEVVSRVRENEIGVDPLQILERLLDRFAVVRHVRRPGTQGRRPRIGPRGKELLGTRPGLRGALALGAEDDPCT